MFTLLLWRYTHLAVSSQSLFDCLTSYIVVRELLEYPTLPQTTVSSPRHRSTCSSCVACCSAVVITSPRHRVPASGLAQVTIACDSNFPVSLQTWFAPGNGSSAVTEIPCNRTGTFFVNVTGATEFQLVYLKAAINQRNRRQNNAGSVFVHWGSTTCPSGAEVLYSGFMATSSYDHGGSGANMLCMHPSPQYPAGYSDGNQNGALLCECATSCPFLVPFLVVTVVLRSGGCR